MKTISLNRQAVRGFSLIEILVVIGIIGILLAASYPSILNTMAVRNLENTTRQIQTFLQQAKLRAVDTKVNYRVRFFRVDNAFWAYDMERIQPNGTWIRVPGAPRKTISNRLNVTISLPVSGTDPIAVFSPVGAVANFAANQNTIVLQNPNLDRQGQEDERVLSLYMGGSIHYSKRKST